MYIFPEFISWIALPSSDLNPETSTIPDLHGLRCLSPQLSAKYTLLQFPFLVLRLRKVPGRQRAISGLSSFVSFSQHWQFVLLAIHCLNSCCKVCPVPSCSEQKANPAPGALWLHRELGPSDCSLFSV